jgi:hypothetical protein
MDKVREIMKIMGEGSTGMVSVRWSGEAVSKKKE